MALCLHIAGPLGPVHSGGRFQGGAFPHVGSGRVVLVSPLFQGGGGAHTLRPGISTAHGPAPRAQRPLWLSLPRGAGAHRYHDFTQGDAMVFVSHKFHGVEPVTSGRRQVCILEFWGGRECTCPHRCKRRRGVRRPWWRWWGLMHHAPSLQLVACRLVQARTLLYGCRGR
jgi:hypothetical protein